MAIRESLSGYGDRCPERLWGYAAEEAKWLIYRYGQTAAFGR